MEAPSHAFQHEIVPGRLAARILPYVILSQHGPVPCWVYASNGLRAHGQREIVFVLRRHPHEALDGFPRDPLQFFAVVLGLAAEGRLVEPGGVTELGPSGFLHNPTLRGFGYVAIHPDHGLPWHSDALLAIALFGQEMEIAKSLGLTRVIARLGHAARQYPCPAWSDRERPCLVTPATVSQSILAGVARLQPMGLTAVMACNHIHVTARASARTQLSTLAELPSEAAAALLCELDAGANGLLVWQPGQTGPEAITPPGSDGSRLSGCFLLCVCQQDHDGGQIFEDGLAMMLTDVTWATLRHALVSGAPLDIAGAQGRMGLSLRWENGAAVSPAQR